MRRDGLGLGRALRWRRRCYRLSALFPPATLLGLSALFRRLRSGCRRSDLRWRDRSRCRPLRWRRRCYRLSALFSLSTLFGLPALFRCRRRRAHGRWGFLRLLDHFDDGRRRGRCRFQFLACDIVERFARIRCKLLLLRRETDACRRGCGAGDDRPLEHAGRRLAALGSGATHASLCRSYWRNDRHRRAGNHFPRYPHCRSGHRLRLHERGRRHGDDRSWHLPIGVYDIGHVRVVVIVVDDRVVDDRVAAVDILEIAAARPIGRSIDLARPKREPRDATDVAAGDRKPEVDAAHEHNQCRGVVGPGAHGTGYPTPRSTQIRPAAVMRHGEAPGRVIHPRPTPGVDPCPMSVAVRRPAGGHASRDPDVAVGRVHVPGAVRIEVLIADHVLRYIAGGV